MSFQEDVFLFSRNEHGSPLPKRHTLVYIDDNFDDLGENALIVESANDIGRNDRFSDSKGSPSPTTSEISGPPRATFNKKNVTMPDPNALSVHHHVLKILLWIQQLAQELALLSPSWKISHVVQLDMINRPFQWLSILTTTAHILSSVSSFFCLRQAKIPPPLQAISP